MKKLLLLLLLAVSTFSIGQVITLKHAAYEIHFDTVIHEPVWTVYTLTKEHAHHLQKDKRMAFHADKMLCKTCQATDEDYKGFTDIYDRGHLSPYKDFTWSTDTEKDSMLHDNYAPQIKLFNEILWLSLENDVRKWALDEDLKITTGVIYGTKKIGKLLVPDYYWKVVQHQNGKLEGWKIPNQKPTTKNYNDYKIDPNQLLKLTN